MDVDVVVPFRGGDRDRDRAWRWVRDRYRARHADWRLVEAPAPAGPWVKAAAVRPAVEASRADVVVVADADLWTDGLRRAAFAVVAGAAAWAMPHRRVLRLSRASTDALLRTGRPGRELDRDAYEARLGGGLVVAARETLLDVPLDLRFEGWGQEDEAWGSALATLLGPPWRGDADVLHLFHEPAARQNGRRGSPESWALYRRYLIARGDRGQMTELVRGGLP